jgi:hypothetical protein
MIDFTKPPPRGAFDYLVEGVPPKPRPPPAPPPEPIQPPPLRLWPLLFGAALAALLLFVPAKSAR